MNKVLLALLSNNSKHGTGQTENDVRREVFNQLISNLHCQRSLQEIFFENILKMIVIVMGVSGSGKSTIAEGISQTLKLPLYDADDFHPITNIKKMATGQPLNDEDRKPWLEE